MNRSNLSRLLTVASAAALLSACAVGPKAPDASFPPSASGAFINAQSTAITPDPAREDWWRLYNDPILDGLIVQAFAENNELEAADANLRAVRASLSEARAGRLPTTSLGAGYSYGRPSSASIPGAGGAAQDEVDTWDVGLDMAYEVDLFGRVGSGIRAARADADAAAARDIFRVSVAAETARAYADACSANARIAVAERTLALQQNTADLTRRLLEGGAGAGLDTARAQSALASTRAVLPTLRAQRDGALYRLSTLTGRTPVEASEAARGCARRRS